MGRFLLTYFTCFLVFTSPLAAQTEFRLVKVTATVTPSPQWISSVQSHSHVISNLLPLYPFMLYSVSLSDGKQPLKNQEVKQYISQNHNHFTFTIRTDSHGLAYFYLPSKYLKTSDIQFVYKIMDQEITLKHI